MVENMAQAALATDGQGRIVYANPAAAKQCGLSETEMLSRTLGEVFRLDDGLRKTLERCARGGESAWFETEMCCGGDGPGRAVHLTVSPLRSGSSVRGLVVVATDISDRVRAEEALKESETRFRDIVEGADHLVTQVDGQGRYLYVNRASERILGRPVSQSLGRSAFDDVYPEDRERTQEAFRGWAAQHLESVWFENRIVSTGGQAHNILWTITLHYDEQGRVTKLNSFGSDVTERERAREELAQSEAKLRSIFLAAPIGIGVVVNRVFTVVNDRFCQMLLYDRAELLGQSSRMIYPTQEEYERVGRVKYAEIAVHGTGSVETQMLRKDGGAIDVLLSSTPLDASDLSAGVTFTALDITARKRLEDQLRQAAKMEAIGQLAGGVAHDFNNQLTVIKGYTDLLIQGGLEASQAADSLEEIRRAAARAERLTSQLLAFGRRQVLRPEVLNLNDIVSEMSNPLSRMIGEAIELKVVLSPRIGNVRVDRPQVEQAIMNLVINARDAMPGGGQVTIETVDMTLDGEYAHAHPDVQAGPHVMLAVTDTGVGMDAATRQRIFEPFFTTKEVGKGTGLGLSMVYGFVKQSGGLIYVYSEPFHGTTFKIYLPRVAGDAEPQVVAERRDENNGGSETVLVVEDDEAVRNFLVRVLRRNGYTVLESSRAAEALSQGREHSGRIDLLIADVVMPQMGGADLARQLQAARGEMKVLFVSGYTENAIMQHGELDRGVNLLTKPFSAEELVRMVRRVLDRGAGG